MWALTLAWEWELAPKSVLESGSALGRTWEWASASVKELAWETVSAHPLAWATAWE